MGKLHTLRREIERDPEKWVELCRVPFYISCRAGFDKKEKQWKPYKSWYNLKSKSYMAFVRHTLINLGYDIGQG